ncbi:MAG: haloacid dehalogenase-like hydrolase [Sideroxydans sp.]|nr:haloacid dehalogenase-like hydrolase [Sideroxydans sp.]
MRIGFDFDNTIVSYDALFYRVAVEQSLVPADLLQSKLAVRDYLRKMGNEDAWTEMQGYVYGARMSDAVAYPGAIEFMRLARDNGIAMTIVSHKTRHPFMGPKYDLHEAARGWVDSFLVNAGERLIEPDQVFFELTKEEKIARIAEAGCDYFIDDLPEILQMQGFPESAGRILFDPENHHDGVEVGARLRSWQEIEAYFEDQWKARS